MWRYVANMEGKTPAGKAWIGQAMHEALRALYVGAPDPLVTYDAKIAAFPEPLQEDFRKLSPIYRQRLVEYSGTVFVRDRETYEVLLAPEAELKVTLGPHVLFAIVDLVVRERRTGHVWVMDHKTAAKTGPEWWAQFYIDKQGSAYTLAVEEALREEVAGFIINAIKPTKEEYFQREGFLRTRAELASFARQTHWALDRRALIPEGDVWDLEWADNWYPQHTSACHGFGTCVYLGACRAGRAAQGLYQTRAPSIVDRT